jgi:hypothetical protein
MHANPFSMRWISWVAMVCLWAAPGVAQEGGGDAADSLPRLASRRGETFKLGKRPYPSGTRAKWIAEGRALGKAPEGHRPRKQTLKGAADNRSILPPIKSQGSEGSCVHWAGAYYTKTASMKRQMPSLNVTASSNQLSPRFTYNLSNSGQDNGAYGHEPFEIFMRYGGASLKQKPYVAGQYTALPTVADFVEGLHRRTAGYVWVWDWRPSAAEINELKAHLDAGGVAVCGVYAEDSFDAWSAGDPPWVGTPCSEYDINHLVTVYGYGPGYYLVANSWGTSFGSNGFIHVAASYFENYFSDVMYPLEGTYEPSTSRAELKIAHTRRSDIRSLAFQVNGATVWSNSPLPKSAPLGSGYFNSDSRDNWELAVDLSSASWSASNAVTVGCMDRVSNRTGSMTDFTVVLNGKNHAAAGMPVAIPDNTGVPAVATISFAGSGSGPVNLKINCGSGAVGEWGADHSWSTVSGGANYTTAGIADTGEVPEAVYQYRRYGSWVTYNLDIPDGRYHVRLHFADLFSSGTGKRIFDVRMEGATVLPNYDIIAAAGGPKRAVAELFENVEVTGGLQLEVVAKLNTAQFNAIEVWTAGPAVVVNPSSVSVPEGGTVQFGVRLSEAPAGNVTVAVARVSGDADIAVQAGSALVFTPANFDVEQAVTLSAAEDDDSVNGVAVIRCSAADHAPADVTATEQDNDVPPVNLKINCGSGAVGEWEADRSWSVVSGGANYTTAGIADTGEVPEAVYQYRRYGSRVTYNLDIPDGRYHVRLHFADLFSSGTGKRIFDVRIEGQTVLPNYDIIAAAGGPKRAVAELFENVEVTGGLQLEVLAKLNTAQFNAIEVWTAGPAVVVNPARVTVPEGGTAQFAVRLSDAPAGDVTVAVARVSGDADIAVQSGATRVFTPGNYNVEQMVTLSAAEDDDSENGVAVIRCTTEGYAAASVTATEQDNDVPPVNLKINCGSGAVGEWGADQSWSVVSGGANYTTAGIADTGDVPEAVYQYRRYGSRVTYNLDIPDGRYNIRLHFADLFSTGTGKRIFDVRIEGQTVRPNYDIIAAAGGPKRAVAELFENVEVTGGLQLEVVAKVNTAQFNGIEVWTAPGAAAAPSRTSSPLAAMTVVKGWPLAWARNGTEAWKAAPELVDGNVDTVWVGAAEAWIWSLAVDFEEAIPLHAVELDYAGEPWMDMDVLGSEDLETWVDLGSAIHLPVDIRWLFFQFRGDGDAGPALREIHWE